MNNAGPAIRRLRHDRGPGRNRNRVGEGIGEDRALFRCDFCLPWSCMVLE